MTYNPALHHRRSIRLPGYDYSLAGAYFVTVCTLGRECLFGDIVDGEMRLNEAGRIVAETWPWLPTRNDHVELDAWVVMPNHVHGVIVLADGCGGGSRTAPTKNRKPLGRLIGMFKTVSSKRINALSNTPGVQLWQRNYWERIIRDDTELDHIQHYIRTNPSRWEADTLHPMGAV